MRPVPSSGPALVLAVALVLAPGLDVTSSVASRPVLESVGAPPLANDSTESRKYWIFLTDKRPAPGKRARPARPGYVAAEARERRRVRGSGVRPWDDAPLADRYVAALRRRGIEPVVRSRWFNAVSAHLDPAGVGRIARLPFVRSVRPVAPLAPPPPIGARPPRAGARSEPAFGPRDSRLDYGPSRRQLATINAITPLEEGIDGAGVILGFLDTRYNFQHPGLRHIPEDGRLIEERSFTGPLEDQYGPQNNVHGLSVSSVAVGFDPGELVGPGYGATVIAATTEYAPREVNREEDFYVAGLEWLERNGVDVVNSSLGYTTFEDGERSYTYADMDGNTAITTRAADRAATKGVVVVASAGNEATCRNPPCWHYVSSPADGDSVIAVGAVLPDSTRAVFSSFGPTADGRIKPDVAAPGFGVRAADRDGYTSFFAGTSAAAPLVAGVAAQILQANPELRPMEVRSILRETAHQSARPDSALGWGIVDAGAAVREARDPVVPERATVSTARPNPFRTETRLEVRLPAGPPRPMTLTLYDVLGRTVAVPFRGALEEGRNTVTVRGTNLPAGVYLYRLSGADLELTGTVVKAP